MTGKTIQAALAAAALGAAVFLYAAEVQVPQHLVEALLTFAALLAPRPLDVMGKIKPAGDRA